MRILLPLLGCLVLCLSSCDRFRGPRTTFDGATALGYVKTQVDFGPRSPGSVGHQRAADWIAAEMRKRADSVVVQRWTHVTAKGDSLALQNVFARINPSAAQRVLYVTHWDTRPTADEDANLGNKRLPIIGANDGASGVALLMAIADALKKTPPIYGVDLLFVDGEDYGDFGAYSDTTVAPDVLIGSTYFVNHLPSADYKPIFGVLWDMIGDKELQIFPESYSVDGAPEVVSRVWQTAADLGYGKYFINDTKGGVTDDHLPFLKKGLRVIDVLDIDYCSTGIGCVGDQQRNYHHTMQDTFDKVSSRSLQIVGDVALTLLVR